MGGQKKPEGPMRGYEADDGRGSLGGSRTITPLQVTGLGSKVSGIEGEA